MASIEPLHILVEFARAENAGDPFGFRFAPQQYLVRSASGRFESATLSWNEALLADLKALRQPGCEPATLSRMGETLRHFLAATDWAEKEAQIVAATTTGRRVILTLRAAAAELYALPWELLTIKSSGQHIAELPEVLIRYEWPDTASSAEPAARDATGRILVAWSAAGGAVPASGHIAAIETACQAGSLPFDVESDVLANASCGRLAEALQRAQQAGRPVAILHLLCHGGESASTFGLTLDGEQPGDAGVVVDAGRLRQLLGPHASTLRLVFLSACDSGNSGALGNHLGSAAQTLHRAGLAQVIASRYPLSVAGSVQFTQAFYSQLVDGLASTETAFLSARSGLLQDPQHLDWASVQLYARAADGEDGRPLRIRPFRGLLAFQPRHRRFFFGRTREIDEIVADLSALRRAEKPRLLVVAGSSGSGKSSLVLAGAVPRLQDKANGCFRFQYLRPAGDPHAALDAALRAADAEAAAGAEGPLLLVVDQFEEIFTQVRDAATRQSFVNRLFQLASAASPPIDVLLTLRVDFLGQCGEIYVESCGLRFDRIAYDESHRVFIAQMGPDDLQAAIEEPLRRVGMKLEEGLLSRILDDIGAEPGALPLLQDTLDILWQRRRGRFLRQQAYDEIGGVAGALKGRADALFATWNEAEQRAAQRLLVRLVSMKLDQESALATRQRMTCSALRPKDAQSAACFDRVLSQLVQARLLVLGGEGAQQVVEVAHEALIRKWPRLHDWLRSDLARRAAMEELEGWAKQWRAHGTVLVGKQLREADSTAQHFSEDLSNDICLLLAASHKRQRNLRLWAWLFLGLGLLPLVLFLAVWQYDTHLARSNNSFFAYVFLTSGILGLLLGPFIIALIILIALWRVIRLSLLHRRRTARVPSQKAAS